MYVEHISASHVSLPKISQTYTLNEPKSKKPWQGDGCWKFAFARLLDLALVATEHEQILNEIVLHLFISCFLTSRKIKSNIHALRVRLPSSMIMLQRLPGQKGSECNVFVLVVCWFSSPVQNWFFLNGVFKHTRVRMSNICICLGVSDVHTRLGISIWCAAHELSYINATGAKLVCMNVCMYVCVCMYECMCVCLKHRSMYACMFETARRVCMSETCEHVCMSEVSEHVCMSPSMHVCLKHTYIHA